VTVAQQICAQLAGAIEEKAPEAELDRLVAEAILGMLAQTGGTPPHRAILGCTHFPLVEHLFRQHLPPFTRILSQPDVVADSFEDYLARHSRYVDGSDGGSLRLLTTGEPLETSARARVFWPEVAAFEHAKT
jgi:glutamate racemase